MSTRAVSCPNCQKVIQVPEAAVGKKIKCKACEHVFAVPGDGPPKPAAAKPVAKPVAKPTAKPVSAPPPPPEPAASDPIPFKDDDDDDDTVGAKPKAYLVTEDPDDDIPRCPFCAFDLDPPDTKICLNCGFDLVQRKRHRTVKTYHLTSGDYFKWWLPAIIWGFVLLACGGFTIYCFATLRQTEDQWRKDRFMVKEDKNKLTGEEEFFLPPVACYVCFAVICIALGGWGVPIIYKRLKQPKPTEDEKHK